MAWLFIQNMFFIVNGKLYYNESVKYMESGQHYNKEWTDAVFPYLKVAQISMVFGKLVMLIMACKWPWLTKYFMCYELLYLMVVQSLPLDYGDNRESFVGLLLYLSFIMFSFNFWFIAAGIVIV